MTRNRSLVHECKCGPRKSYRRASSKQDRKIEGLTPVPNKVALTKYKTSEETNRILNSLRVDIASLLDFFLSHSGIVFAQPITSSVY